MKTYGTILVGLIAICCLNSCGGGSGHNEESGIDDSFKSLPELKLSVLSVGQADSIYIKLPDGKDVLIDGGLGDDVVEQLPIVMNRGDKNIDLVILTHPHPDHLLGLLRVLKRYSVKEIWETGVGYASIDYELWKQAVKKLNIPNVKVMSGKTMMLGQAELQVIAPTRSYNGVKLLDPNTSSIVCQLNYGSFKALLLADADIAEQKTFTSILGHVNVMKVAHHGASNAAYAALWERTTPNVSILTAGRLSEFVNLPSKEALSLIARYAKKAYRTDRDGIVTIKTNGITWDRDPLYK